MVDGRVEPHRKATYTLDISDQVRREGRPGSGMSGVKCTHMLDKLLALSLAVPSSDVRHMVY